MIPKGKSESANWSKDKAKTVFNLGWVLQIRVRKGDRNFSVDSKVVEIISGSREGAFQKNMSLPKCGPPTTHFKPKM